MKNISDDDFLLIRKCFLFEGLTINELEEVLDALQGTVSMLSPKEFIFYENDYVTKIGCVLSGEVRALKYDIDGNENLLFKVKKTQTFGANVVYTPTKVSPFNLYSQGISKIYIFNSDNITKLNIRYSLSIYYNIMKYLSNDNIRKQNKIDVLSKTKTRDRILEYLNIQREKRKTNILDLPFNREEMASYLCVNRSVLSHELSMMQEEGLIKFRKNHFELLV